MNAVNLIPTDQRRARPSGGGSGGAYAVVGLLAVLLVMAVGYVMTANNVNEKRTAAAEARQEANALEDRVERLASYTDFGQIKQQRLASVVGTAQSRFDWERLMREVSRVIPKGSWLQSAQASVTGGTATSGSVAPSSASGTSTSVVPAGPTATFVGCTPEQSEVAKLMVRLRAMHRVTDVKLNESVRQEGPSEVTVENCGRFYQFDVTVTFEGTPPVNEDPRGATSVPASLGGGS